MLVLGEMSQAHSAQYIGGLSELDIVVADDLDAVAPGIAKIEEGPTNQRDTSGIERFAGRLLVIDDESDMTAIVGGLSSPLLQGDELVPQIDERHGVALAAQFECEETPVKRQRLFDVTDLQRYVVESNESRPCVISHGILLCERKGRTAYRRSDFSAVSEWHPRFADYSEAWLRKTALDTR